MRPRCTNEESCIECTDLWFTHCSLNCQLKEHNIRTGKQLCYDRCTVWRSSDWHYFCTFHTTIVTSFIWNNIKSQTGKCYHLVFFFLNMQLVIFKCDITIQSIFPDYYTNVGLCVWARRTKPPFVNKYVFTLYNKASLSIGQVAGQCR